MKKYWTIVALMGMVINLHAISFKEELNVDGFEREYLVYVPTSYDPTASYDMLFLLHPFGTSAADFAANSYPQLISDANDCLVVYPQALDEQDPELVTALSLFQKSSPEYSILTPEKIWGAGMSVSVDVLSEYAGQLAPLMNFMIPGVMSAGYAEVNKNVDDVKYLNTILDELSVKYNGTGKLYMAGASIGGAMVYRYAYESTRKPDAIAVVSGFVGTRVDDSLPLDVPVLIFHSLSDGMVKYEGGIFNAPIPETINKIVMENGCTEATSTMVDDIANDGITLVCNKYVCDESKPVVVYLADFAAHKDILRSDYISGPNDIDYVMEIEKFFFMRGTTSVKDLNLSRVKVIPNPTTDFIEVAGVGHYSVYDQKGALMMEGETDGVIDVSSLIDGLYSLRLQGEESVIVSKFVKK